MIEPKAEDFTARAQKLATEVIGIDSHIDTIQRVLVMGEDLGKRHNVGHVDIPRLQEGGMHAPFFAFWVPVYFPGAEAVQRERAIFDLDSDRLGVNLREIGL